MATIDDYRQQMLDAANEYKALLAQYGSNPAAADKIASAKKKAQDLNDAFYSMTFDEHNTTRAEKKKELAAQTAATESEQATYDKQSASRTTTEAQDRRRRAAAAGVGSTVLTSPLGLAPEPQSTKRKTLLGG